MNALRTTTTATLLVGALIGGGCQSAPSGASAVSSKTAGPVKRAENPLVKIDFRWNYDRAQAKRLFEQNKFVEAQRAFQTLAATAPNALEKAKCLVLAAIALGHQDEKYNEALQLAEMIADDQRKAHAQMTILFTHEKFQELVDRFRDEDLSAWPADISNEGFYLRGRGYYATQNIPAAIADYEACMARLDPKERLWPNIVNSIASLYRQIDNDAKALETYEKAFAVYDTGLRWTGSSYHGQSVLAAAAILESRGREADALALLTRYEINSSSIGYRVLETAGDLCVKLGRRDEAIARYREAIASNTRYETKNAEIQKKIDALK